MSLFKKWINKHATLLTSWEAEADGSEAMSGLGLILWGQKALTTMVEGKKMMGCFGVCTAGQILIKWEGV